MGGGRGHIPIAHAIVQAGPPGRTGDAGEVHA